MSEPGDSLNDFGLVIAFVLPGLTFLFGCRYLSKEVQSVASLESLSAMSISSLVLFVLLSIAAGLLVQTIRWLLIDTFHHHTGIRPGKWDFAKLPSNLSAFDGLTENHYRFYQFYAGMVIGLIWILICHQYAQHINLGTTDLVIVAITVLMLLGSRDTLRKYYSRLDAILTQA